MSLVQCRACGCTVSAEAAACPHCGAAKPARPAAARAARPTPVRLSTAAKVGLACLGLVVLAIVVGVAAHRAGGAQRGPASPTAQVTQRPAATVDSSAIAARNRHRADSILSMLSSARVTDLSSSDIDLVLANGDSASYPDMTQAVQREAARRALIVERQQFADRISHVADMTRAYRMDDGQPCRRATRARITTAVRGHPEWSDSDLASVACGAVWIGMTADQLLASRGKPQNVHRTVNALGTSEQWVYGDLGSYVYLDDGRVSSWQH